VVKATIVEKYFDTWAKIICRAQDYHRPGGDNRIGYVDLFAGPGRYKDGAISMPVRVLEKALSDQQLSARLVTIFNDRDPEHTSTLRQVIKELSGIENLTHAPRIWNQEVGDQIAQAFDSIQKIPILAFIDPWGIQGTHTAVCRRVLEGLGL
jgi:three-Cys-motif partner protein